jgi:hypothetical protein
MATVLGVQLLNSERDDRTNKYKLTRHGSTAFIRNHCNFYLLGVKLCYSTMVVENNYRTQSELTSHGRSMASSRSDKGHVLQLDS